MTGVECVGQAGCCGIVQEERRREEEEKALKAADEFRRLFLSPDLRDN